MSVITRSARLEGTRPTLRDYCPAADPVSHCEQPVRSAVHKRRTTPVSSTSTRNHTRVTGITPPSYTPASQPCPQLLHMVIWPRAGRSHGYPQLSAALLPLRFFHNELPLETAPAVPVEKREPVVSTRNPRA